jgi:hypothetical protein
LKKDGSKKDELKLKIFKIKEQRKKNVRKYKSKEKNTN